MKLMLDFSLCTPLSLDLKHFVLCDISLDPTNSSFKYVGIHLCNNEDDGSACYNIKLSERQQLLNKNLLTLC